MNLAEEHKDWLADFEKHKGRKLRVLHVGNIAANGFLNAKFLRQVGIEADVLCYNYYHIMAYPEWEELNIQHDFKQDDKPQFSKKDRKGYQRPRWFVQGPLSSCFEYLFAKNSGNTKLANKIWKQMDGFLFTSNYFSFFSKIQRPQLIQKIKLVMQYFYLKLRKIPSIKPLIEASRDRLLSPHVPISLQNEISTFTDQINAHYAHVFPERQFQLTYKDIEAYYQYKEQWQTLFNFYDVIQCYSTDPIYGLLFSKKPYVSFEHGTLRTFTSDDCALNALTSLAYRQADHVFITNGDCLEYAKKLNITNYSPIIHPINVNQHRVRNEKEIQVLKKLYQADILLFCPVRHDWEIKGTDIHLRALPLIIKQLVGQRVVLVTCEWGMQTEESKNLIKEYGCENNVIWIKPLCRLKMISHMQAADVILDQLALPCFGGIAPQAVAAGTPVIMSYKPESTEWIVDEPAPILPAFNEEDVARQVVKAIDVNWRKQFISSAINWVDTHHHVDRVISQHLTIYKKIIDKETT